MIMSHESFASNHCHKLGELQTEFPGKPINKRRKESSYMDSSRQINKLKISTHVEVFFNLVLIFVLLTSSVAHPQDRDIEELIEEQSRKKGYYIAEGRQTWEIKRGGTESESTQYVEYRITNKQGWKKIIPYMIVYGWKMKVDRVEIIVQERNDKPKKYKKKDLVDAPAYAGYVLYSDMRMLILSRPFTADEGKITVSYRLKESQPVLSRPFFVQSYVPVKKSSISIKAPKNWEIQYTWRNGPPEGGTKPGQNVFMWSSTDIQPLLEEPFPYPPADLAQQVIIRCDPPRKDEKIWAFSDWDDLAEWAQQLFKPQTSATPEMEEAAAAAVQGANSRLEKIRCLYDLVRKEIRYVAIEIGIGGYQPYPASQTFEKKYGDCKDKATLLCTLLKSVDITAYPVLVRIRDAGQVIRDFPSPYQFNHCITYIPSSQYSERSVNENPVPEVLQEGIFLDATAELCPFGDLPLPDQDTWGLIVSDTGGELKRIPSKWFQPNKTVRITEVELRAKGNAVCSAVEKHYGIENQIVRMLLYGKESHERQEYWAKKINKNFPRSQCREFSIVNDEDSSLPFEIHSTFSVQKFSQQSGNLLIFPAMYWKRFQKNPFTEDIRIHPIFLMYRRIVVDTLYITMPDGYVVDELPGMSRVSKPFGEFVMTFETLDDHSITITRSCKFTQAEIPREQYEAFRAFIDMLIKKESEGIVLKKS